MPKAFAAIGLIAVIPLAIITKGIALQVLWGWFVVPLGIPDIGMAHALGIAGLVALATHQHGPEDNEGTSGERALRSFAFAFARPLVALLFGWIFQAFM